MEIVILDHPQRIGALAADAISGLLERKPEAVIGLATGTSPLVVYEELATRHAAGQISFAKAKAFTLDEYVGIPRSHPESYHSVIHKELVSRVDFAEGAVRCLDSEADDLTAECNAHEQAIKDAGGVDLQLLGIGTDGHIAFNEPGSSLASRTRVKNLTHQTRKDNARFFDGDIDQVPRHCLTQGLGTIMDARHIVLIALGAGKAKAISKIVEGAVSTRWPGSILQHHPHVTVLIDNDAAVDLELVGYYREAFDGKLAWQSL